MKMHFQFGNEFVEILNWYNGLQNIPHLIIYKSRKWEFAMYEEDDTNVVDYELYFAEVPTYDPNYAATTYIDFTTLTKNVGIAPVCECGTKALQGQYHMFYCPMWKRS